jgi:hypothetical protein
LDFASLVYFVHTFFMRFFTLSTFVIFCHCASPETSHNNTPIKINTTHTTPNPSLRTEYKQNLSALVQKRNELHKKYQAATSTERANVLAEAKAEVFTAMTEQIFPAWFGTSWDYSGTTQTPGEGKIACGYFVSTTLRDAGFLVERIKMAQQASENIIRTLSPASMIWRFRKTGVLPVLDKVKERGDGLYLVGLDNHVGYISNVKGDVSFCHASYLDPGVVTCEPAESAQALHSNYYVLGELLNDDLLLRWLMQEKILVGS